MSAQELPYEIISMTVLELKLLLRKELSAKGQRYVEAPLASYATICKSWNQVIERETFRSLRLSHGRMDRAEKALDNNPTRRSAVREILFLTPYYYSSVAKWDLSEQQLMQQDAAFSRDLLRLFRFLASMEKEHPGGQRAENLTLKLEITVHLLTPDDAHCGVTPVSKLIDWMVTVDQPASSYETLAEMGRKQDAARLHYVGEALPTIHCVRQLLFPRGGQSLVWPNAFAAMFSVIHGLEYCRAAFDDKHTVKCSTRIGYRKALGETLRNIPTTCKTFHADFGHEPDGVNAQPGFDYGSPDTLCIELRNLSMRLVKMSLKSLVISPSLFWPDDSENAVTPYWPCLKDLEVEFAPSLAGGEWLMHENRQKREPLVERSQFTGPLRRLHLDDKRANALLLAAAKANRKMPSMKNMRLYMSKELGSILIFTYRYTKERRAFMARWVSFPDTIRVSANVLEALGIARESLKDLHDQLVAMTRVRLNVRGLTGGGSVFEGLCSPAPTS